METRNLGNLNSPPALGVRDKDTLLFKGSLEVSADRLYVMWADEDAKTTAYVEGGRWNQGLG